MLGCRGCIQDVRQTTHSQLSISIDRSMKSNPFLDLFHPCFSR